MPVVVRDKSLDRARFSDIQVVSAYEVSRKVVFCCIRAPMTVGCGSFYAVGLWYPIWCSVDL